MVSQGKGRLFRRKDGKYLVYLPVDFCEDSMFPFKNYSKTKRGADSVPLKAVFTKDQIILSKWES